MRAGVRTLAGLTATGALAVVGVLAAAGGTATADDERRDLAAARAATSSFHDLDAATGAGYTRLEDASGTTCIEDAGGAGAMGTHYVLGGLVGDGVVDVRRPEVLLYDLTGSRPRLLGAEYVVFVDDWGADREPPSLFGEQFHRVPSPNRYGLPAFYALHAWLWEHNRAGTTADWNPRVDC